MLENAGKLWTVEQIDELKRRFGAGEPLEVIHVALGRSPGGVVGKLCHLGLLFVGRDGHYYPTPETPWVQWQEVKQLSGGWK